MYQFRLMLLLPALMPTPALALALPQSSALVSPPRSADTLNQTAMLVYQDKARVAALVRQASAALIARDRDIASRDAQIAVLQTEQARSNVRAVRERAARQAEIDRLTIENANAKLASTAELAARDADYARERSILLSTADRLLQTPEGARVLRLFNAGGRDNWQEAKAVLAQMQKLRTATDRRDGAVLYLQKRARGEETTDACIAEYEAVVANDPREHWDWVELTRLYSTAGRSSDAVRAAQQSLATSPDDRARSVALNEIGDVRLLAGDRPGALAAFEEGLTIARRLAERDPGSAQAQRDVWVSLNKVGDVRLLAGDRPGALAAFEDGLTIARRLAERDPGSAQAQRDVSVSLERVGDVRLLAGDRPGALAAFEEGLAIRRRLAERDPGSAQAQRDVSLSLERVGDVRLLAGDRPGALAAFEEGLAIRRRLAERDPGSAQAQRDVWVSLWRLASMDAQGVRWQDVVDQLDDIERRGLLLPSDAHFLVEARALAAAAQTPR